MGPRRRNQLISLIAVTTMTMLVIQYTGYNSLHNEEVRLRYINPSLPSERTEDEDKFGMVATFSDKKVVIHRGAGRHLQEENRLPDAVVIERQPTHKDHKSGSQVFQNINKKIDVERTRHIDREVDDENSEDSLGSQVTIMPAHKISMSFLKMHYCPACLGTSLCKEFIAGNVTVFRPVDETLSRGHFPGSWNGKGVILHAPGKGTVDTFTQFVCTNSTKTRYSEGCDVSEAIMESILSRSEISLSPHEMKQSVFPQDEDPLSIISPSTCAYGNFFAKVKQHYNITNLKSLNNSIKMSSLMSTMLLDPLPVILKFIENEAPSLLPYFPKYLGACGHVAVIEEEGLPLINFLPDSWEKRVELALEVFRFIDDIWSMSAEWGFLLLDFSYKNFVVLPDGRLQLIAPEKLLVVDKIYFEDIVNLEVNNDPFVVKPSCNKICLVTFLNQLIMTNHTECSLSINPHQFMYMMASHMLLSDLYTTRNMHFFSERHLVDENHPGGLLYDIPSALDGKLSQLLYECILESQGGSRLNSVKMLKRLLQVVKKGFLYKKRIAENKKKIPIAQPG